MNLNESQVWLADARHLPFPNDSMDLIVTSPPYWNLRDYNGTDGQIGLEDSLGEFFDQLRLVIDECWRVLTPTGNLFVNIGDTYLGSGGPGGDYSAFGRKHGDGRTYDTLSRPGRRASRAARDYRPGRERAKAGGYQPSLTSGGSAKSRALVPQRFALMAFDAGWLVRQEIIWRKPSGEISSCLDRALTQHEQIWHFTKQRIHYPYKEGLPALRGSNAAGILGPAPRSVWDINPQPIAYEHFAAFPQELVRRCILGWAPEKVCNVCDAEQLRIVEPTADYAEELGEDMLGHNRGDEDLKFGRAHFNQRTTAAYTVTGLTDCGHNDWRLGRVFDPFVGTGTTVKAARDLGRIGIGTDNDPASIQIAEERAQLNQLTLDEALGGK